MKRAFSKKNLWEKLPRRVKSLAGGALSLVPQGMLFGRKYRETMAFLAEADHWPAERWRAWQIGRVREMCRLACEGTAFYRKLFAEAGITPDDIRTLDDLRRLPTIDKSVVREAGATMCARPPHARGVDMVSTSGTGGVPLHFYMPAERSGIEYAYLLSSWRRVGYLPTMPMAVLRGRVIEPDASGLRHQYDPLLRHHYYGNFHMTEDNMARYLAHMRTIGPCFLHGYPSALVALARFIRRSGMAPPANVVGIIAESEIVYPEQRELAEGVFNCRYFSCYGHSEKLVLASECEHATEYHVWPTYGLLELLDEQGRPVTTPGQRGEIVGTGFMNHVMPFIRYRTGDEAIYVGDRCEACGREQMILRDIRGHRTQEVLVAGDGSLISWTSLVMHDDTFESVRQFQFYQETPGQAVLRIVPTEGFNDAARRRIEENLGRKLGGQVRFWLETVDEIPLSKRGKAIYVDQRCPLAGAPSEAVV